MREEMASANGASSPEPMITICACFFCCRRDANFAYLSGGHRSISLLLADRQSEFLREFFQSQAGEKVEVEVGLMPAVFVVFNEDSFCQKKAASIFAVSPPLGDLCQEKQKGRCEGIREKNARVKMEIADAFG